MGNIRNSIALFGKKALGRKGRPLEVIREHEDILRELSRKSAKKAAKAMSNHLDITQKSILQSV